MKLNFIGQIQELEDGISILGSRYNYEIAADGLPVEVERSEKSELVVCYKEHKGYIRYNRKIHFFRALGLFLEGLQKEESFSIEEEPQFSMNGIMFDVSRNAVLKIESIKKFLEYMAVMGLNMFMLYTEDTYTIENKPYFGYMRGRYTFEEIKECDDFAETFGIEIIPSIQTLAHLTAALKWGYAKDIKDTDDILLVGEEKTYKFISEMIDAACAPLRSKRIHIGMDEAHNLGLGRYLDLNGYKRRFDIMNDHLERVRELTVSKGLKPMMWADMYFRIASETGDYYDLESGIPQDVIDRVPKDVQMVCWDYYHNDSDLYKELIKHHKMLGETIFAGGIWTWNGIAVNYTKTFLSTNAALNTCKQEGIKEVFATLWGDNGGETDYFSALLGFQLYAEHGYAREIDMDKLKKRFEFCTGANFDLFMLLDRFDNIPATEFEKLDSPSNPSKLILWQDILIGLFDKHFEGMNIDEYYSKLSNQIEVYLKVSKDWEYVFELPYKLSRVLAMKSEMGIRIKSFYEDKDLNSLQGIVDVSLPELYKRVNELRISHRTLWHKTCKPFGWEVLDIRYGGILARIDSAISRLSAYITGDINIIEELEEERLFFDGRERSKDYVIGRCNNYHRIATASAMGFNG